MRIAFVAMNPFVFVNDRLRAVYAIVASAALLAIVLAGPLLARDVPGDAAKADVIEQGMQGVPAADDAVMD